MQSNSIPVNQLLDFQGQVVLVTGAGGGLGSAIARRFAQAGARVAVHYHNSRDAAYALVDELAEAGTDSAAFTADLRQPEAVADLFAQVYARFGRLDALVNNAGTYPVTPLMETTHQEWDAVMAANLRSVFLCTQAAARWMAEDGRGGAVINIASLEALQPSVGHSHYDAAKAGVVMLTRSAALELGKLGIRVNALSPGLIWRTGIAQDWPQGVAAWQAAAPLQRLGQPEDVADACLFLASAAARWISGINLVVDGGMTARSLF